MSSLDMKWKWTLKVKNDQYVYIDDFQDKLASHIPYTVLVIFFFNLHFKIIIDILSHWDKLF